MASATLFRMPDAIVRVRIFRASAEAPLPRLAHGPDL